MDLPFRNRKEVHWSNLRLIARSNTQMYRNSWLRNSVAAAVAISIYLFSYTYYNFIPFRYLIRGEWRRVSAAGKGRQGCVSRTIIDFLPRDLMKIIGSTFHLVIFF